MKISLVVPSYNEEENVNLFYNETVKAFNGVIDDYEIIFVDDGSSDKTFEKQKAVFEQTNNVKVVSFSRNFGKEAGIYAGLKYAEGDYVCVIDADLQQRPEVVVQMKEILDTKPDVDCVAAFQSERRESRVMTFLKDEFYEFINKISDVYFYPDASDFRLMRRQMVDEILNMSEYHRFSKGLFSFVGFNTEYIPYDVQERAAGESKWNFIKLFKYALDGIVGFTTTPLRMATFAGMGLMLVSVFYLIIALIIGACTGNLTAVIAIIFLVLFVGGLNLLSLGIIGEYLSKTYIQVKNRPIYIAKHILDYNDKK